jgi:hypothetical protein
MGLKNPSIFYVELMIKRMAYLFYLKKKTRRGLLKNGVEEGETRLIFYDWLLK